MSFDKLFENITYEAYAITHKDKLLTFDGCIPIFPCHNSYNSLYMNIYDNYLSFACQKALTNYGMWRGGTIKYRYCYIIKNVFVIVGKILEQPQESVKIYDLQKQVRRYLYERWAIMPKHPIIFAFKQRSKRKIAKALLKILNKIDADVNTTS